jgi:hypothetical protein
MWTISEAAVMETAPKCKTKLSFIKSRRKTPGFSPSRLMKNKKEIWY